MGILLTSCADVAAPRKCPGIHFGEATLFITVATILHALEIEAPVDEKGRPKVIRSEDVQMKESFLT